MRLSATALILSFALAFSGCGTKANTTCNDSAPAGATVVTQGDFGGSTISGSVTIYSQGPGAYIIRLVDLSAPTESGLQVIPTVDGSAAARYSLKCTSGNQNYNFTYNGVGTPVWNQIVIHSVQQNRDLGVAGL